jgi:hypothetical protein
VVAGDGETTGEETNLIGGEVEEEVGSYSMWRMEEGGWRRGG